mmetsp:Transcript_18157/g.29523  ORF Transcript_18157/g.29523 Transcript_18157/m.29523 type:complete len:246 (+) Transcript_18157:154-891(+)
MIAMLVTVPSGVSQFFVHRASTCCLMLSATPPGPRPFTKASRARWARGFEPVDAALVCTHSSTLIINSVSCSLCISVGEDNSEAAPTSVAKSTINEAVIAWRCNGLNTWFCPRFTLSLNVRWAMIGRGTVKSCHAQSSSKTSAGGGSGGHKSNSLQVATIPFLTLSVITCWYANFKHCIKPSSRWIKRERNSLTTPADFRNSDTALLSLPAFSSRSFNAPFGNREPVILAYSWQASNKGLKAGKE